MIIHYRLLETGLLEGLEFGDVMVDELADALEVHINNLARSIMICSRARYTCTYTMVCIAVVSSRSHNTALHSFPIAAAIQPSAMQ
eukprot:2407-Heterococcus_DN1.PRE.2